MTQPTPGFTSSTAMYDAAIQGPFFLFTPSIRPLTRYPAMHTRQPLPPHLMPTVRHKWQGAPRYFAVSSVAFDLIKSIWVLNGNTSDNARFSPRWIPTAQEENFCPYVRPDRDRHRGTSPTPSPTELVIMYRINGTYTSTTSYL